MKTANIFSAFCLMCERVLFVYLKLIIFQHPIFSINHTYCRMFSVAPTRYGDINLIDIMRSVMKSSHNMQSATKYQHTHKDFVCTKHIYTSYYNSPTRTLHALHMHYMYICTLHIKAHVGVIRTYVYHFHT